MKAIYVRKKNITHRGRCACAFIAPSGFATKAVRKFSTIYAVDEKIPAPSSSSRVIIIIITIIVGTWILCQETTEKVLHVMFSVLSSYISGTLSC